MLLIRTARQRGPCFCSPSSRGTCASSSGSNPILQVSVLTTGPVPEEFMFSTLESTWDHSVRRRWTTLASFSMQALGLSLLLAVPMLFVQGPPRLQWLAASVFSPPPASAPPAPRGAQRAPHASNMSADHLAQPAAIPNGISTVIDHDVAGAPDFAETGVPGGTGHRGPGVPGSTGDPSAFAPPPPPAPRSWPRRPCSPTAAPSAGRRCSPRG